MHLVERQKSYELNLQQLCCVPPQKNLPASLPNMLLLISFFRSKMTKYVEKPTVWCWQSLSTPCTTTSHNFQLAIAKGTIDSLPPSAPTSQPTIHKLIYLFAFHLKKDPCPRIFFVFPDLPQLLSQGLTLLELGYQLPSSQRGSLKEKYMLKRS